MLLKIFNKGTTMKNMNENMYNAQFFPRLSWNTLYVTLNINNKVSYFIVDNVAALWKPLVKTTRNNDYRYYK